MICDTSQLDQDKLTKVLQMKCVLVFPEHIPSKLHEDGNGVHDTLLGTQTLKKFNTAHKIKNNGSPHTQIHSLIHSIQSPYDDNHLQ